MREKPEEYTMTLTGEESRVLDCVGVKTQQGDTETFAQGLAFHALI